MTVGPARRRSLGSEVADVIREAIFDGRYPPGSALREVELSEALRVSRGPVRDALRVLEQEGLVRAEWHRGATVAVLSLQDVAELDSLRGALEALAVERVVASGASLDAISAAALAMERASTPHEMVRCDIAFHDAVYAAAGHSRLVQAWQAIRSQVHLFLITRVNVSTDGYLEQIRDEHRDLVAALRLGDAGRALELFAEHRRHAFDLLTRP
ncbi:DNA-binding transcriptional regulator, GntR family [Lentzea xinjiangensis]|uniref:DNA-binding transcriptional regulator, GntR family n=1 Tax=Lentzea xinjiangensis TaxID=402600 RepID=A0A1H9VUL8_9PSEU|nr:GntR family transcriptional regulator [Lentzea xinjiangensis]SES25282.1 DNA-binding transcriptional regulator, GntR family [Lentzea xinjiangensis]